jgi:hypothetical protein
MGRPAAMLNRDADRAAVEPVAGFGAHGGENAAGSRGEQAATV